MLRCIGFDNVVFCKSVKEIILCDTHGMIHHYRMDLNASRKELLSFSNPHNKKGAVKDALYGADVFIGVSMDGDNDEHNEYHRLHKTVAYQ